LVLQKKTGLFLLRGQNNNLAFKKYRTTVNKNINTKKIKAYFIDIVNGYKIWLDKQ
jgi:hypothetical protein